MTKEGWHLHLCTGWTCGPWRLNLRTPHHFLIVALTPGSRVARWSESVWVDWRKT